jgi:hypothetical protein
MRGADNERFEKQRRRESKKSAPVATAQRCSDMGQGVADSSQPGKPEYSGESRFGGSSLALFSTPVSERRRLARPVLLQVRTLVRTGMGLLEALVTVDDNLLHREFARHVLITVVPFGQSLDAVSRENGMSLLVLERAIARCTPVQVVRGGWTVTAKRSA